MFTFEPGVVLWTLISFAVVLAVIARFVYPPVKGILDRRRETIASAIADAERRLAEAAERAAALELRVKAIGDEEARIIAAARERAREIRDDERKTTARELRELRKARQNDLAVMERDFVSRAQKQFSELVIEACRKILRSELTEEMQHRILDQRIEELEQVDHL